MQTDPLTDYTMQRIIGEIRRFAQRLEKNEAISQHPEAIKAIIDEYDNTKDALQQPWVERTAKSQTRGIA